jgi:hypothetical protein
MEHFVSFDLAQMTLVVSVERDLEGLGTWIWGRNCGGDKIECVKSVDYSMDTREEKEGLDICIKMDNNSIFFGSLLQCLDWNG